MEVQPREIADVDTICALSSARGKSAIAIFRISGPEALSMAGAFLKIPKNLEVRKLYRSNFKRDDLLIDEVVFSYFRAPASYTGEDLVEIYCHGNPVIVDEIESSFVSRGTRGAEPGEFTRRALINGKASVSEVESLNWVLNARGISGVSLALNAKLGSLGLKVGEFRRNLLTILSLMEAQLDFESIETGEVDYSQFENDIKVLILELERWVSVYRRSRMSFFAPSVVIAGPPNAGKSSLFNGILREERAIVHQTEGTTRDLIESLASLNECEFRIQDTAGIRQTESEVENIGIHRTRSALEVADIILWMSSTGDEPGSIGINKDAKVIRLLSRSDEHGLERENWLRLSIKSGEGIEELKDLLVNELSPIVTRDSFSLTSERQCRLVNLAKEKLEIALELVVGKESLDIIAEEVLHAGDFMGQILGKIDKEEVLQEIFSQFCIGK